MTDERATAAIERSKSYMYDELTDDENSLFYKHNKTDVFIAAMGFGYFFKESSPVKERQDLFVSTTLSRDSEKIWLMKSVAMSQCGISVLKSMNDVVKICQEFANSGINRLYKIHKESENEVSDIVMIMEDALDSLVI